MRTTYKKTAYLAAKVAAVVLTTSCMTSTQALSAAVDLHAGVTSTTFVQSATDNRLTFLEVLASVTIQALGVEVDPLATSTDITWRIFNASNVGVLGSLVSETKSSFADIGPSVYDTSIGTSLTTGFYLFEFDTDSSVIHQRYNENQQGLPFVSTDGNFRVIDGAQRSDGQQLNLSNSILPAFSVTTGGGPVATVPLPAALPLMAGGLGIMGLFGWRRKRMAA